MVNVVASWIAWRLLVMSRLRRLVIFVIFGLSALIVLDNANSVEQVRSLSSVAATTPMVTEDRID